MGKKATKKTHTRTATKKEAKTALIPVERIERSILLERGQRLKFSPVLPWAFTEHGTIMAAEPLATGGQRYRLH